jgi:hypothetical protein
MAEVFREALEAIVTVGTKGIMGDHMIEAIALII